MIPGYLQDFSFPGGSENTTNKGSDKNGGIQECDTYSVCHGVFSFNSVDEEPAIDDSPGKFARSQIT